MDQENKFVWCYWRESNIFLPGVRVEWSNRTMYKCLIPSGSAIYFHSHEVGVNVDICEMKIPLKEEFFKEEMRRG